MSRRRRRVWLKNWQIEQSRVRVYQNQLELTALQLFWAAINTRSPSRACALLMSAGFQLGRLMVLDHAPDIMRQPAVS